MTDTTEDTATRIQPTVNKGGVWVRMGMEEYKIPPLGFGAIRELQSNLDALQGMKGMPNEEQMNIVGQVVQAAIKRNYPDMTLEKVLDMLDLGNFQAVFSAVMSLNGYRRAESGEARATSQS